MKVNCVLLAVCLAASCCRRLTFSLPGGGGVAFALAMAVEMMPLCSGGPRKQIVSARTLFSSQDESIPEVTPYVCCSLWRWRDWSNWPTLAVLTVPSQIGRNALCLRLRCLCQNWSRVAVSKVPSHSNAQCCHRRLWHLLRELARCPCQSDPPRDWRDVIRYCPCWEFCASSCCSYFQTTHSHLPKTQASLVCDRHQSRPPPACQSRACCIDSSGKRAAGRSGRPLPPHFQPQSGCGHSDMHGGRWLQSCEV